MPYFIVRETQVCHVDYLVKAKTPTQARTKAKKIDQDAELLDNYPNYISSESWSVDKITEKQEEDPVVKRAIANIEAHYQVPDPDEEPSRKPRKKRKLKDSSMKELSKKTEIDQIMELGNEG